MAAVHTLANRAGLRFELDAGHGAARRLLAGDVEQPLMLNLFPGNAIEGGPANVWLRRRVAGGGWQSVPLFGPRSPLGIHPADDALALTLSGSWQGLVVLAQWRLAEDAAAWFWHVRIENRGSVPCETSLMLVQDVGLASPQTIAVNEFYVSQYIDWQPLADDDHGWLLAARQNQAQRGLYPWLMLGSLGHAVSFGTDALQFHAKALHEDREPPALQLGLPGQRLQHEHSFGLLEDANYTLVSGSVWQGGFFGALVPQHEAASSDADRVLASGALALPEAAGPAAVASPARAIAPAALASLAMLPTRDLREDEIGALFGPERLQAERGADGRLLSFFQAEARHVVLRAKELLVDRPHGHVLRAGQHLTPDERALTSTCWMGGIFHSMLTQGHVKLGRMLSTQRGMLGFYRSQGLRAWVRAADGDAWQLLGLPSAFEIEPQSCRWLYAHDGGLIEVRSSAGDTPERMALTLRVLEGEACQLTLSLDARNDDDDAGPGLLLSASACPGGWRLSAPAGSELGKRLPGAALRLEATAEAIALDGLFGLHFAATREARLTLIAEQSATDLDATPQIGLPTLPALSGPPEAAPLATMLPWLAQNALVHYLAPRGLEQYSGGGWGVRDVCQGPLEMLLALGRTAPVRDLLLRVFSAQNADGDWPQWFMFFARDADIRAGDSHGDIVFWPLLGVARYLIASGDAALLDEPLPYHDAPTEPLRAHMRRALNLIARRMIPGHSLVAYGHGDWNDALQPADPALRESLCSAWTVTLHAQMLTTLAEAYEQLDLAADATALRSQAGEVHAAFQRELVRDGIVTGYAHFPPGGDSALWIHPSAPTAGLHYSLLPMMHSVLENLLTPAQAAAQADAIDRHLQGPDGARLFDAPLPYHGGLMTRFQRAESSSFFGREIGIMYMHAHLRWAQMLAHLGRAEAFWRALNLAHPILIRDRVPSAGPRQANCYYSSSDAAFADRYEAHDDYGRVAEGSVQLDGGWRVYSSGPGIMLSLVINHLLGLRLEHDTLLIDPVMPQQLAGLRARVALAEFTLELHYQPGPQGAGVTELVDAQGQGLPFTRRHHPYRPGAVTIPRPAAGTLLQIEVRTA